MPALVAVVKRVAVAILSNPKILKKILTAILVILVAIFLPIGAILAIFSGEVKVDVNRLEERMMETLTREQKERLERVDTTLEEIENQMQADGHSAIEIQEAQVIYIMALVDVKNQGTIPTRISGCFLEGQTDAQFISKVNQTFGTSIDAKEYELIASAVRGVYIDTSDYYDASTKNNIDLVKYAKNAERCRWGYVWGTYGRILDQTYLNSLVSQYPEDVGDYEDFIRKNYLGGRTADCGGLIKGYCWYDAATGNIKYGTNGMPGIRADEIYNRATEKGKISTIPEIEGLAVWHKGHIGVYIGNGEVIEAKSTKVGVVKTKLSSGKWTHWLKVPYITYVEETEE